jgi:hypothetical protein
MAEPVVPPMTASDFKMLVETLSEELSKSVIGGLEGFHYKIVAAVVGSLVSAIIYMYLTQRSDQKESAKERTMAYNKLLAVISESTKLMTTVKNDLKTVAKLKNIVKGCPERNKDQDEEDDSE